MNTDKKSEAMTHHEHDINKKSDAMTHHEHDIDKKSEAMTHHAQAEEMQHTNSQLGDSSCAPAATLTALKMIQALPTDATERLVLTDGLMRLVRQRACKCRHTAMDADSDCDVSLQTFLLARGACGCAKQ